MRILALDTATENCSAAVWIDGQILLREAEFARGHAERILTMIDEVLVEAGATLQSLDAIAFGQGPGSFTGVRLAASVTQGLAFGAGVPVVPVSDLLAVAQRARLNQPLATRLLVCNDARMKEVYWGCFDCDPAGLMVPLGPEQVSRPLDVSLPEFWHSGVFGAGRGFAAYGELRERLAARLASVDPSLLPRASEIAVLAVPRVVAGQWVRPEEAVPVYLRDDVARPKS